MKSWQTQVKNSNFGIVGGRKKYNFQRQEACRKRLVKVIRLQKAGFNQSQIAAKLGVSEATISLDIRRKHKARFLTIEDYDCKTDRFTIRVVFATPENKRKYFENFQTGFSASSIR
jgi:predicted transcriptional regulator